MINYNIGWREFNGLQKKSDGGVYVPMILLVLTFLAAAFFVSGFRFINPYDTVVRLGIGGISFIFLLKTLIKEVGREDKKKAQKNFNGRWLR